LAPAYFTAAGLQLSFGFAGAIGEVGGGEIGEHCKPAEERGIADAGFPSAFFGNFCEQWHYAGMVLLNPAGGCALM
jgi:hypothetical protein